MKTKVSLGFLSFLIITIVIVSCKKNNNSVTSDQGNYSSTPSLPEIPYVYSASGNNNLTALGRVLFYDKSLSLNNSVSCASCHQQSKAFCDNLQFSTGLENVRTQRNTPSIFAKSGRMFWDGRASSLGDLALKPIKNHVEMKFENLEALAAKISKISYYPELFRRAFPSTSEIDSSMIQQALADFLRNFNFSNNKFSLSRQGLEKLNASEKLGKILFFGKARCSNCHHIEGNGNSFPGGNGGGYGRTDASHNIGLDNVYADNGLGSISKNPVEDGSFMVPALLNVEYTAPYMHDGRFKTLEEVVEHYNSGVKNHPNLDINLRDIDFKNMTPQEIMESLDTDQNGQIDASEFSNLPPVKLGLTESEKRSLVDFLRTLSDPTILKEPKFSNPFQLK